MASLTNWSFNPLISAFPPTVFPNIALWNISNGANLEYQVQVSWPLEWTSRDTVSNALTMYVLDGNALGTTATEAFRRRRPVEPTQPDSIVVSIGYPLTNSPYSPQRGIDFQPPKKNGSVITNPDYGADTFLDFIDGVLRPFVRETLFPRVNFTRDALYGHSFGGLFVLHALLSRPALFDTFLMASPALFWEDGYILSQVHKLEKVAMPVKKPALVVSYGGLEQFPVRRRTETEQQFEERRDIIEAFKMTDNCRKLYRRIEGSTRLRDVKLKEYGGSDHASVGAVAITDGIDYFVDW